MALQLVMSYNVQDPEFTQRSSIFIQQADMADKMPGLGGHAGPSRGHSKENHSTHQAVATR